MTISIMEFTLVVVVTALGIVGIFAGCWIAIDKIIDNAVNKILNKPKE